jgi:hypothetical protein
MKGFMEIYWLLPYSNAGSAAPNMGQDMITMGYRF